MKKILLSLAALFIITVSTQAQTQTKFFAQTAVSVSNKLLYESLEFGATTGKNRVSILVETHNKDSVSSIKGDRKYFGGIRYTRGIAVSKKLDFLLTGVAKVQIDNAFALSVEPGVGIDYNITPAFAVVGYMTSPIYQNTRAFNPVQLKASVGLQVRL